MLLCNKYTQLDLTSEVVIFNTVLYIDDVLLSRLHNVMREWQVADKESVIFLKLYVFLTTPRALSQFSAPAMTLASPAMVRVQWEHVHTTTRNWSRKLATTRVHVYLWSCYIHTTSMSNIFVGYSVVFYRRYNSGHCVPSRF